MELLYWCAGFSDGHSGVSCTVLAKSIFKFLQCCLKDCTVTYKGTSSADSFGGV